MRSSPAQRRGLRCWRRSPWLSKCRLLNASPRRRPEQSPPPRVWSWCLLRAPPRDTRASRGAEVKASRSRRRPGRTVSRRTWAATPRPRRRHSPTFGMSPTVSAIHIQRRPARTIQDSPALTRTNHYTALPPPLQPRTCTIPTHLMSERLCHCTTLPPSPASDPHTPAPYPPTSLPPPPGIQNIHDRGTRVDAKMLK